jgi:hypothetical protein
MPLPETIGEWVLQADPLTYDRETIFDYINGAGEVYRSYAFSHVVVNRYATPAGLGVTVEVFDMGNAEDAFGVFSYAREDEEEGIGAGFERKGSVLCFWQDRFYVCVAAEQRDEDPEAVLGEVARGVSGSLPAPGSRPALMSTLPEEGRIAYSDRFFHTHQSLNYQHYLARENVLQLTPETDAALARFQPGSTYLLVINYENEGDASAALSSFRAFLAQDSVTRGGAAAGESAESGVPETVANQDGSWASTSQRGSFVVAVLAATSEEVANELRAAALVNITQLQK